MVGFKVANCSFTKISTIQPDDLPPQEDIYRLIFRYFNVFSLCSHCFFIYFDRS